MKNNYILKIKANFTNLFGISDLKQRHREVNVDTQKQLKLIVLKDKNERYANPLEACKILGVSRPSSKKGYLEPIEMGDKRRYRMSDIKRILHGGRIEK